MSGVRAAAGATVNSAVWRRLRARSPFVLLLLTPIVTLPVAGVLIFTLSGDVDAEALGLVEVEWTRDDGRLDRTHYYYFDFWRTWLLLTVPGVINLLVAWWLFHRLTYVRLAAGLGLLLALLRTFVVPVAAITWLTADVIGDAGLLLQFPLGESGLGGSSPSRAVAKSNLLTTAWMGGLGMWLVTFGLWRGYEPLMARFWPALEPPRERVEGEPRRWTGFGSGRHRPRR